MEAGNENTPAPSSSSSEWPHPDDGICQSLSCDPCQHRILKVTCKFFQDEYRKMLFAQHGKANICPFEKCNICSYGFPERITCPGCNKPTGKTRQGLLALEVGQIHSIPEHMTLNGNIKPCECIVHMKFYIICSAECHKKSIFKETTHQGNFTYNNPKGGPEIPESGPVCTTRNYAAEKKAKVEKVEKTAKTEKTEAPVAAANPSTPSSGGLKNKCAKCGKDSETKCSRCKKVYYCSVPCQRDDWKTHKNGCIPAS